jgi:DNA-binding MarR family transcriptional regulator
MAKQQSSDFVQLFNEVRLTFHQLSRLAEGLHESDDITAGQRGVLEMISAKGPLTVPAMALERGVTRQMIQIYVDELKQREFVEIQSNPAHKRSGLVAMTAPGLRLWKRISAREAQWFHSAGGQLSNVHAAKAASELKTLREDLQKLQKKGR